MKTQEVPTFEQPVQTAVEDQARHGLRHRLGAALAGASLLAAGLTLVDEAPADAVTIVPEHATNREATSIAHKTHRPVIHVGTMNILGSNHVAAGHKVGGSVAARASRTAAVIKNHFGIVGTQETTPVQKHLLQHDLGRHYTAVPAHRSSQNTIFFNNTRFKELAWGKFVYPFYDEPGDGIWVRLKDKKSGQNIFVSNDQLIAREEHPSAKSDRGGAKLRYKGAVIVRNLMKHEAQRHANEIIINTSDSNATNLPRPKADAMTPVPKDPYLVSHYGDKARDYIPYCVYTASVGGRRWAQSAYDLADGLSDQSAYNKNSKTGHCPDTRKNNATKWTVDWILKGKKGAVLSYHQIDNARVKHATDHLPVEAAIAE